MYYVLHNPKSNKGLSRLKVAALIRNIKKKHEVKKVNVIRILNEEKEFLKELTQDDALVICGGDGTINRFVNGIIECEIICKVFIYQCGSGNDMSRDFQKGMFEVTDVFKKLPKVKINGQKDATFINGIGMGFDALVCQRKEEYSNNKIKKGYGAIALESLKDFKPYSLDIEVDGEDMHFDNVLLFVVNHGKYFGGGMKITPKADRHDGLLDFCIVHTLSKAKFVTVFPTIFLGTHIKLENYVTYIQCKSVKVKQIGASILQADGEVSYDVKSLEVRI
jgi:diacylglycerol kinase family enzyme